MEIILGIDLGTTFCCLSYLDEEGSPIVIKNGDGEETTPSVIWFNGKNAIVGKKAELRKNLGFNEPIFEEVKRNIGKSVPHFYVVNGYDYQACGMSSIILKKLKIDAFNYFRRKGTISQNSTLEDVIFPAIITVPASYTDRQRQEVKCAGYGAGLDVIATINEPTAASLTYGRGLASRKKIMVSDLGGGTYDVTILETTDGKDVICGSDGSDSLGGKDWDQIFIDYFKHEFHRVTGKDLDDEDYYELQKLAVEAKFALTEKQEHSTVINSKGESVEMILYREKQNQESSYDLDANSGTNKFYFEERASTLLGVLSTIVTDTLLTAKLTWNDIDEIVLAGGSSRMPMISKLLENLSGKSIKRNLNFNLDTSISVGASIFSRNRNRVVDVTSKSVGIELKSGGKPIVEHLIKKNTPLPIQNSETLPAEANAVLKVYEGESPNPELCKLRGSLELGNEPGIVTVTLSIDTNGVIKAGVHAGGSTAELKIKSEHTDVDCEELKTKIAGVEIKM